MRRQRPWEIGLTWGQRATTGSSVNNWWERMKWKQPKKNGRRQDKQNGMECNTHTHIKHVKWNVLLLHCAAPHPSFVLPTTNNLGKPTYLPTFLLSFSVHSNEESSASSPPWDLQVSWKLKLILHTHTHTHTDTADFTPKLSDEDVIVKIWI